ncbi:MAG: site-specific integrase [Verrucomicrobia bacterium]|nr:site-specific integrase [Verrucomicrobiota bacterium]
MKAIAAASNIRGNPAQTATQRQHKTGQYVKVFDPRKRRVRGLWQRNGAYYAQIMLADAATGRKCVRRVRLEDSDSNPVQTVAEAVKRMNALKVKREENRLALTPKRAPTFSAYAEQYFDYYEKVKDAKRDSTLYTERVCINHWKEHLGQIRLNQINRALVNSYIAKRQAAGRSGRTVNLEVIAFRNVMKRALDDGWITRLPTENLRPLKWTPRKRRLMTPAEVDRLCAAALKSNDNGQLKFKNGQEFADYVRFLQYSGARRNEALRIRWADVDFERRLLTIGADGQTKNRQHRVVDLNPKLEAHLRSMAARRAPDSQWVFPSPQRGDRDMPGKSFVETMRLVRDEARLTGLGFHDLRHFFCSMCVMSGIDFMTIAKWVGHQDGGILIGKVYGHLSNEHTQRQAQKVVFGSVVMEGSAAVQPLASST